MTPQPQPGTNARAQRKMRNFLLDARFQLKFAAYFVVLTLVISAMLGVFLWSTTSSLFSQMASAVDARSKAADTSRDLGTCSINNEFAKNMDDPEFAKRFEQKSKEIDANYEAEKQAVIREQQGLVLQQKQALIGLVGGLLAFTLFIAGVAIMLTHRIVGPLFRIKRMAREVGQGIIRPPAYGLRPGDELQDVFEVMASMVKNLRDRTENDLKLVEAALGGTPDQLKALKDELTARLAAKDPGPPPRPQ